MACSLAQEVIVESKIIHCSTNYYFSHLNFIKNESSLLRLAPILQFEAAPSEKLLSFTVFAIYCVALMPLIGLIRNNTAKVLKILRKLQTFIEDVVLLLITAIWMLSVGAPYGILVCWRILCTLILKYRYGYMGGLVDPLDAIGTVDSEKSKQIITSLKVLSTDSLSLEELRKSVQKTVGRRNPNGKLTYPKFHQYLDKFGGFFCWKPVDFDINQHVRYLDEGVVHESQSENKVLKKLSKIANDPFEPNRANWEILYIPKFHYDHEATATTGIENEDVIKSKQAIIIRIHHAIGDGFSLMKLIMKDIAGEVGEIIPVKFQKKRISFFSGFGIFLYLYLKSGRALFKEMLRKDRNPLCHGKLSGKKCILWSKPVNIDILKEIKCKLGTGMSTLLISAVAEALESCIQKKCKKPTTKTTLSTVMPVPAANHPDNKMCNKFSVVMMSLPPPSSSQDTFTRCQLVDKEFKILSQSPDAPLNIFLMSLVGLMPHWFYSFFLTNTQSTVLISNIPGPDRNIKLWGHGLEDTMFWLPSLGVAGISVSFLSYKAHMRIGLTVDTGVIPEGHAGAEEILQGIISSLTNSAKIANGSESNPDLEMNIIHPKFNKESHSSLANSILVQRKSLTLHSIN